MKQSSTKEHVKNPLAIWISRINFKILITASAIVMTLALLSYYHPLQFKKEAGYTNFGNYDYQRIPIDGNKDNYYYVYIEASQFGYIRARRASKIAAADLAIRLGYSDASVLKVKKRNPPDKPAIIIAKVYLYESRNDPPPPRFKPKFNAREHIDKERYPIFLENLDIQALQNY
ncbi:hypothetical protein PVA45_00500 [Entomospira entomophila]|uniref:Uncharacterized protein n=1 Tax=Entomospira entomophila TaxID=2719988 RepID=A0A968GAU6_9SPIO|nr:hypothetical protein [Entomospira entomophilus]NIZ40001.1 hypothetical protein [Entomospira entomophilus]WDI35561.1 hypothetical protein PVA45_00500 [Entomospira entomophilus]